MRSSEGRERQLKAELSRLQQHRLRGQNAPPHSAHAVEQAATHLKEVAKHLKNIVPIFRKSLLLRFSPIKTIPDHFKDYGKAQQDYARAANAGNHAAAEKAKGKMARAVHGIYSLSLKGKLEFEMMEKAAHHAFSEIK